MGKGVGGIKDWVFFVKKGTIILEVDRVKKKMAYKALKAASLRIAFKVCVRRVDKKIVFIKTYNLSNIVLCY